MTRTASQRPTRFHFFGGKGGVGKTTCAAAAAVAEAQRGARVLVVSTDPAHSLGDALDRKLGPSATTLFARPSGGALLAAELDADRALERWLERRKQAFRAIAARGTYLDDDDIDRFLALSLPGVDELIGLVELARLARASDCDRVVVDTAPTGHTLRLLAMPDTLRRIAAVLDDMQAKHRFLAESIGGAYRPDATDDVVREVEEEANALNALLRDPARADFACVLLPEAMSVEETKDGVRALDAMGVRVRELVVNRRTPRPDRACPQCTPRVREEERALAELERAFPTMRIATVPATREEPRGVDALLAVARSYVEPAARATTSAAARSRTNANANAKRNANENTSDNAMSTRLTRGPTKIADALATLCPPRVELVLFGGKGGVGKSTCAAAVAIEAAGRAPKSRVLLLSTDPAHSLADALGAPLGDDARRVKSAPQNLFVRELDADAAFRAERDRYRDAVDALFDRILRGSRFDVAFDRTVVQDLIDLAPPGLDELFGVIALVDALAPRSKKERAFDLVIVDTAPTGHTMRLLAMPKSALEWVHALMAIVLKYRQVVGLGDLAADLVQLSKDLHALERLLVDRERARFVVVTRAAELPQRETARLVRDLAKMKIAVSAVIVNAVTAGTCSRCTLDEAFEAREIAKLARLGHAIIRAPATFPPPHGPRSLHAFARRFELAR